jgi:ribosome-associated protein
MVQQVAIRGETIRLGQLLKLAGIVSSGSEVKMLLAELPLAVNGELESRRGRQLHPGDRVQVGDHELLLSAAENPQRAPETERPSAEPD